MNPIIRRWLTLVAAFVGLYLVLPDRGLAQSITLARIFHGPVRLHDRSRL